MTNNAEFRIKEARRADMFAESGIAAGQEVRGADIFVEFDHNIRQFRPVKKLSEYFDRIFYQFVALHL
ncbi:MAG: hypothetical protein DRI57_21235 [Deltaproteobacteria bacterium]|nr:MAG: hypothetical protein DRI57_21235 [Deltaproteobacteria bacterium]